MADLDLFQTINALSAEEEQLWASASDGSGLTQTQQDRLDAIKVELDRVRTDVVPEYGFGRFENNAYNVAWNVHTLVLLARSGVLDLDAQPPALGADRRLDNRR